MLTVFGLQVPLIPLADEDGNGGTAAPAQMISDVPKLKVGAIFGFTVTDRDAFVAHCPDEGVNVYEPEVVLLMVDGFQVPGIPLEELPGKDGTEAPAHIVNVVPKLNEGIVLDPTVTE